MLWLDSKRVEQWNRMADECQRRLSEQQITPEGPGSILKDVGMLLAFVGESGVVTKSRNATFPLESLPELNRRSSYPIELPPKRAFLRDYPNLAGVYILLRVLELIRGSGRRLIVPPERLETWNKLNPTEQYFALLEAFLFHAQGSVLSESDRRGPDEPYLFAGVTRFLGSLKETWRHFKTLEYEGYNRNALEPWALFLLHQFGLLETRPQPESERIRWQLKIGWDVRSARLTPFGAAATFHFLQTYKALHEVARQAATESEPSDQLVFEEEEITDSEDPEEPVEERTSEPGESDAPQSEFGTLQPFFKPYFPEWQALYERTVPVVVSGTFVFKVSLTGWRGIWRRLAVPPGSTLDDLAFGILAAFKFDSDHLYDFRYRDARGLQRVFNHPFGSEGPFTDDITIAETELPVGGRMLFTFDYGDSWRFNVQLEKIDPTPSRARRPKVIDSAGTAPEQYRSEE